MSTALFTHVGGLLRYRTIFKNNIEKPSNFDDFGINLLVNLWGCKSKEENCGDWVPYSIRFDNFLR